MPVTVRTDVQYEYRYSLSQLNLIYDTVLVMWFTVRSAVQDRVSSMKIGLRIRLRYRCYVQNNQAIFTQNLLMLLNVEILDWVGLGDVFHKIKYSE